MKNRTALAFVAALLLGAFTARSQTVGVSVEGKITRSGAPLPNAQLVFTNADNGRVFKTKTDNDGKYVLVGVPNGTSPNFRIDVLDAKGEKLYTKNASTADPSATSFDISANPTLGTDSPAGPPAADAPKLTKEQLAKIEADNKKIAGLNSLITEAQNARQAQDWPKAENALKQLIAAAPDSNRWDFYMFLGEAQTRSNKLQDAVQTYEKGIQLAGGVASGSAPANAKVPTLNPASAKAGMERMLTAQGNDYLKLQKADESIAALKKAAALNPTSGQAAYNLCGVTYTAQKIDEAKAACNKYLQIEPSGAHATEVKDFLAQMGQK